MPSTPIDNQMATRTVLPKTTYTLPLRALPDGNHRSGPPRCALPLKSGFPP